MSKIVNWEVPGRRTGAHGKGATDELQKPCDLCEVDSGGITTANGVCRECKEYMCSTCFRHHQKAKTCRNHVLIDIDQSLTPPVQRRAENVEKCNRHANEKIKFYCRKHKTVGCGECIIPEHSPCGPENIKDLSKRFHNNEDFKSLIRKLQDLTDANHKNDKMVHEYKKANSDMLEEAQKDIKTFRTEINNYLDKDEESIMKDAKDIVGNNDKLLAKLEQKCKIVSSKITDMRQNLDKELYQDNALFIQTVNCKPRVIDIERDVSSTQTEANITRFEFKPDRQFQVITSSVGKLGSLSKAEKKGNATMTNVDAGIIKDPGHCLKAADELSELGTEEPQQLHDLHRCLQKKQKDGDVKEEIKKEVNEMDKLKDRTDQTSKSAIESNTSSTDLGRLWTVLKDEYWQPAFNAFISETKDSVQTILETLIAMLNVSFHHCKERAAKSRDDMIFQVYYPGENALQNRNLKIPKPYNPNLEGICKACQIKSIPFCLPSIQQAVMIDVKSDRSVAKLFRFGSKMLSNAVTKYLEKCVEFCWIASLEDPEVSLITSPLKECKNISHEFIGIDRITYRARPNAAYVEWPAIVQADKVLMQWHLYTINQPRPEAIYMRGHQNQEGQGYKRISKTKDTPNLDF